MSGTSVTCPLCGVSEYIPFKASIRSAVGRMLHNAQVKIHRPVMEIRHVADAGGYREISIVHPNGKVCSVKNTKIGSLETYEKCVTFAHDVHRAYQREEAW